MLMKIGCVVCHSIRLLIEFAFTSPIDSFFKVLPNIVTVFQRCSYNLLNKNDIVAFRNRGP
jgi:hypothetical protein